ncbi:ATP-binding protein [Rurimicrobium arvi]|uniref:Schlafen AlbA-2 domain-containing protein n=1 Tax=Rurimicrobium arvi TaxID=2049916 RepID=A0ABP8ME14_9BACT
MKYSVAIFGKDLYNLTYEDLERFFSSEKEETLNLEFKSFNNQGSYKDKEKVIFKSVCALLNSEGGIIIWGAPSETKDANGNAKATGALTPFDEGLDRDKLINKISSNIIPMPIGIRVMPLKNGDSNNAVIVIEVDKSIDRPHQFDNRYFLRLDGQTRIAPHYLIKALIQGKDFPVLRGHIKLRRITTSANSVVLTFTKLLFNTSQFNNEINAFISIIAYPGDIVVNRTNYNNRNDDTVPILTHGRPLLSHFDVIVSSKDLNKPLTIGLQFGGEKSPSKISSYVYNLNTHLAIGDVVNEEIYLTKKSENELPSEKMSGDEDTIKTLLSM